MQKDIDLLFSDYFAVEPKKLEDHGAFNISLVTDLPLFIDPFLLFNSDKKEYKDLHNGIIKYLKFLRDKSVAGDISPGLIKAWYSFKEVHQNWFGFSATGNKGSGLGKDFAQALNENFGKIFKNYGNEVITHGSHLEKLCLIKDGVGRDCISDFTTNLIKEFLLSYTQEFAKKNICQDKLKLFSVEKTCFNYETESWVPKDFTLPHYKNDFVLLTPKDILTKDDIWINKNGLYNDFQHIRGAIDNDSLRAQLDNFLKKKLGHGNSKTKKEDLAAYYDALVEFPALIDYYIKYKEDNGYRAQEISNEKVESSKLIFAEQFVELAKLVLSKTKFSEEPDTYEGALKRASYVKHIVEDCDGYRDFYHKGNPIKNEETLKILYRMTWYFSGYDVNTEANNGRGPADMVISNGSADKTIIEFKLASNSKLKQNLQNQTRIYEKAGEATHQAIKMIVYFSAKELERVKQILEDLKLENNKGIVLIDARNDNKPSASNAKS